MECRYPFLACDLWARLPAKLTDAAGCRRSKTPGTAWPARGRRLHEGARQSARRRHLPLIIIEFVDVHGPPMSARRPARQILGTFEALLTIEFDQIAGRITEEHQGLDAHAGPKNRAGDAAALEPFLHLQQFLTAGVECEMRILGATFNIRATLGTDANGRVRDLDRSEKRLLDPNPAAHHFGIKANAFLKIAAGNTDVVKC